MGFYNVLEENSVFLDWGSHSGDRNRYLYALHVLELTTVLRIKIQSLWLRLLTTRTLGELYIGTSFVSSSPTWNTTDAEGWEPEQPDIRFNSLSLEFQFSKKMR